MIAANLVDWIAMNAKRRHGRVALVDASRRVTYDALYREVLAIATSLQADGVARGDVIGLGMRDGIDCMATMLAILRLGAVLLPIDPRWTVGEQANVARHFRAKAIIREPVQPGVVEGVPTLLFEPARLLHSTAGLMLPQDFSADEPLLLSLSSGTTGRPKGPVLTHRHMALRHYAEWLALGFLADDVNLCATPLYFGGGRGFTLSYLMAGGTVVLHTPPYELAELAEAAGREVATTTFLVPTLLRRLAAEPEEVRRPFRAMRLIVSSGSALHASEADAIRNLVNPRVVNLYASTEGGGVAVLPHDADPAKHGSVGRPILGSVVSIDDGAGNELPPGESGLIRQKAPWHPAGFLGDPEATAQYFRNGWHYPGDVGMVDQEGFLHITGRAKDVIIRAGVNIYPDEVEAALLSHPAVTEAAVVGRASPELGEEVVAFIVSPESPSIEELRRHCRSLLAPYKVPVAVFRIPELPRNPSGKTLKPQLRQMLTDMSAETGQPAP
jgi:acyl-CoA synthetase (AMP-forming)/AMP-acid ligase II